MTERIAIIGRGNVGDALRRGLERADFEVRSCGKEPEKVRELAAWGQVIVFAVPFAALDDVVGSVGDAVRGRVVVDVTNALTSDYDLAVEPTRTSGAEELQRKLPDARVVKAFNTVFAEHMDKGEVNGETLTLFVAGDSEDGKARVREMGEALGFDVVDAGALENARWMETLGRFNIELGMREELGRGIGFRLVRS